MKAKIESNKQKMSEKTFSIIQKQLEKNITSSIDEVCKNGQDCSFQNLGRILYLLEIFRVLQYDENSNFIQDDDESTLDNERKFNEMCMHEKLWLLLCN